MLRRKPRGEVVQFRPRQETTAPVGTENIPEADQEAVIVALDGLLSRARNEKQREDFDAVMRVFQDELIEVVGEVAHDPALTADIMQDVMLTAWEKVDEIPSGESFRHWLMETARETALQRLQLMEGRETPAGLTPQGEGVDAVEQAMAERREVVRNAIEQLPAGLREVINLHYTDGKSVDEIAQELGETPEKIQRRIDLAQRNLQMMLRTSGLAQERE
jgi:RNA polymerase sigma factor (sigma-70 family)